MTKWYLPKYSWEINRKKYKGIGRPSKSDYKKKYLRLKSWKPLIKLSKVKIDKSGNWEYKAKMKIVKTKRLPKGFVGSEGFAS